LDANTPAERREKPHVSPLGAAESAANPADSPAETASAETPESGHDAGDAPDAEPVGEHFAEAVAMLDRLPLSDAERAEAVRRLLANRTAHAPAPKSHPDPPGGIARDSHD